MRADDYQVSGSHYKGTGYEHWTFVLAVPLNYFEGVATKYVVRWRKKGTGVQDLRKSLHFLNKLDEDGRLMPRTLGYPEAMAEAHLFASMNNLSDLERRFMEIMSTWTVKAVDLAEARNVLFQLLDEAEKLDPMAAVPLTEENHYAERAEEK